MRRNKIISAKKGFKSALKFFFIPLFLLPIFQPSVVAGTSDFLKYINKDDWDYQNVLVLGVGADGDKIWVQDIMQNYYFDKIIIVSEGHAVIDSILATLSKLGIPTGTIGKLSDLKGKKVKNLYAHSWGTSEAINFLSMSENTKVNILHCMGSPESAIFNYSLKNSIKKGIVRKVYFHINENDLVTGFRHFPKLGVEGGMSGEVVFLFYKTERKPYDTQIKNAPEIPVIHVPLGFDKRIYYNCPEKGHGLPADYFKNMSFILNRDPDHSPFGRGGIPPFYQVPSYLVSPDIKQRGKSMNEAQTLTGTVRDKSKAIIVGKGDEADLMYGNMVQKLGEKNVKRIDSFLDEKTLQLEARKFGADVILGVRDQSKVKTSEMRDKQRLISKNRTDEDKPPDNFRPSYNPPLELPPVPAARGMPDLGGVILYGPAEISGLQPSEIEGGKIDSLTGQFSLIVKGAQVSFPKSYIAVFISVLMAVYYDDEAPGISIDPICDGCERMIVRFIGKTRNSRIGRVLFEADRLMKCYYLSKDNLTKKPLRPPIPGFRNVFELIENEGLRYLGAWVRFWFVPDEMRFRRTPNAIVFESAKIELKTEYLFNDKKELTEPSAQAYARFFTERYDKFAEYNPIFGDLLEYAKMVSIAQYLKENRVPLGWLIQSNINTMPYMETPTSTPALTVTHEKVPIRIYGGVHLKTKNSYVIDRETAEVIQKAIVSGKIRPSSSGHPIVQGGSMRLSDQAPTFTLQGNNYRVLPISRLITGAGQDGLVFHTDYATWKEGEPGIELIRYYDQRKNEGIFGCGWNLLVPYRIEPANSKRQEFLNALLPEKMVIVDLVHGKRETLTFSDSKYQAAAYVPGDEDSRFIGLFLMSDGSFRLGDRLGNEFWFDPAGRMTDMIFSEKHRFHFVYFGDKIAQVYDGQNSKIIFNYRDNKIISAVTPDGGKITYDYDRQNRLRRVVRSGGESLELYYDNMKRVTAKRSVQ